MKKIIELWNDTEDGMYYTPSGRTLLIFYSALALEFAIAIAAGIISFMNSQTSSYYETSPVKYCMEKRVVYHIDEQFKGRFPFDSREDPIRKGDLWEVNDKTYKVISEPFWESDWLLVYLELEGE